jgi:dTDP-4-dehydrorhamnose reductase
MVHREAGDGDRADRAAPRQPQVMEASEDAGGERMSKWLVTGASGMLGRDLSAVLSAEPDIDLAAAARSGLDITDPAAVRAAVAGRDVVVNAAAWTDVDGAESDEAGATAINQTGAANVAAACAESGAVLLHVSTDYVFSGDATLAYPEDAPIAPVGAYGRSKAAGEAAVRAILPDRGFVVRTAWLYGEHGRNFVATMLRAAADRQTLDVVSDAVGQPTWSYPLARQLLALGRAAALGHAPPGAYHGTASGSTTWYGLARAAFELAGLDPDRIRPVTSERFPRPARRPAFSVLGHEGWARAGIPPLGDWRQMLADALSSPGFKEIRKGGGR